MDLKPHILLVSLLLLSACSTIPHDYPRQASFAIKDTQGTELGKAILADIKAHKGQSGFMPLSEGVDALAARLGLAEYAEKTLDVQYYIWRGDLTGVAMAAALLQAADRGVRIRLLLDDLQTSEHDMALLALHKHPKIEVRMFNPSAARSFKAIELLSRFSQLNRRMHNKSFIADNQMAIVGGRNIGNEYFNADPEVDFTDFDVLAIGPVVPEISTIFDLYWNSELAIPITALYSTDPALSTDLEKIRKELESGWQEIKISQYAESVRNSQFVKDLESQEGRLYWGTARAIADGPNKFLTAPDDQTTHMGPKLLPVLEDTQAELFIVSPYFVPGNELVEYFGSMVKRGVKVTILTNSLASNDVGIVHAAYSKYREALIEAGVTLYEYKPNPLKIKKPRKKGSGFSGSSRASLHAKVLVFDRENLFVGSMNLDPRSVDLNSELGVVFSNAEFASGLVARVEKSLLENSYRIGLLNQQDEELNLSYKTIVWDTIEDGEPRRYTSEPHAGFFRKLGIWFMSLFVSEELL